MIERVKEFILAHDLLKSDDRVLVAVSGGVDSMVLLRLLSDLKFNLTVAHMNYQLRGDASNMDEELVRGECEQLGVKCLVERVELFGEASVQMEARERRYEWFNEILVTHGIDKIATAHHLNDSLETVLLNLSRGTGIMGLAGIPIKIDNIIRPLLCLSREEIETFARDQGVKWREDESNKESKYQRNLIRNEVLPLLEQINPSLLNTFKATQERLLGVREVVSNQVEELEDDYVRQLGDLIEIELSWITGATKELMLLSELLKKFGVSYALAKEIFECDQSGKKFKTSTHTVHWDRQKLIIEPENQTPLRSMVIKETGHITWGRFTVEVSEVDREEVNKNFPCNEAFLDSSKITFPIEVRSWKLGDDFQPFGMRGRKKLSDFFIDEKVPRPLKNDIPIFISGGRVVWVGGYRIDNDFRVNDNTKSVIHIRLNEDV